MSLSWNGIGSVKRIRRKIRMKIVKTALKDEADNFINKVKDVVENNNLNFYSHNKNKENSNKIIKIKITWRTRKSNGML